MGYKTWSPGDVLTATEVMTYLMKQVVVTCTSGTRPSSPPEGMVIFETDTDRIYVYNGTAWVEFTRALRPAQAIVSRPAAQSVGSGGTGTAISFTSEDVDTASMVDLVGSATNVVIPFTGTYAITGAMTYAAGATGTRSAAIYRGGVLAAEQKRPASNSSDPVTVGVDLLLTASDVITLVAFHTQGAALNVSNSTLSVRHTGFA